MKLDGINIKQIKLAKHFANFFEGKVRKVVESCRVDDGVDNGHRNGHGHCPIENLMAIENITKAFKSMKKTCEGYDRIP